FERVRRGAPAARTPSGHRGERGRRHRIQVFQFELPFVIRFPMREVRFLAGILRSGRTGSGEEDYIAPRGVSADIDVLIAKAEALSSFAGRARAGDRSP